MAYESIIRLSTSHDGQYNDFCLCLSASNLRKEAIVVHPSDLDIQLVHLDTANAIAEALGVPLSNLIGEAERLQKRIITTSL